jgi:tetratricopeptide (TPR) repeat protein
MLVPFTLISTVSETANAQLPSKKQRQQQAKASFKAGKEKMAAGNYGGALIDFQLADTSWPGAAPKYNIAFCHDKLGHNKEALSAYRLFLNSSPSAKYADRIALANKRIAELEAAEKASATGKVMFTVNPPIAGISIRVDGQPVTGTESDLPAGPHTVEASAPGYAPFTQSIDVVGGTQLEVPIALQAAVTTTPRKSNKGKPLIIAGFVVGGVGVVSGVLLTVFGVQALGSASDFDATPTEELADDTDRNGLIADVFLPFTIVGIGAGAVLLGIGYSQQSTGMIRVSPMRAAGGGGVEVSVDF